jgi:CTP:molybdopterin cytidylyltransferase MocA
MAAVLGTSRKALAMIGDQTSLGRTLHAVRAAGIENCITVSGMDAKDEVHHGDFLPEGDSAVENARLGLEALGDRVDGVLFIPADTPLLGPEMLLEFAGQVADRANHGRWFAAGLTPVGTFREAYPEAEATPLKLRGGRFLSGALYATSPEGLQHALELISDMRRSRKSQLGMAWKLGPFNLARYLLGRVSLSDAERIMGRVLGGDAIIIPDCHPATCLDFDTAEDFRQVLRYAELSRGTQEGP